MACGCLLGCGGRKSIRAVKTLGQNLPSVPARGEHLRPRARVPPLAWQKWSDADVRAWVKLRSLYRLASNARRNHEAYRPHFRPQAMLSSTAGG